MNILAGIACIAIALTLLLIPYVRGFASGDESLLLLVGVIVAAFGAGFVVAGMWRRWKILRYYLNREK